MIRPLNHLNEVKLPGDFQGMEQNWLASYSADFRRRIIALLGYEFRKLPASLAFLFLARHVQAAPEDNNALAAIKTGEDSAAKNISRTLLEQYITVFDLKRLESYSKNLVDFHLIMDLVPTLAKLHFLVFPQGSISLSFV